MPLIPKPAICDNCNRSIPIVGVRLLCDACGNKQVIATEALDSLITGWPLCCSEFMSLEIYSKCDKCGDELKEYFSHGRLPLDCLPGTYDSRVFIGGNYQFIKDLRDIKESIYRLEAGFTPILPYDDFQIPPGQVYDTDLRLLHNCKYAIFEVTHPGGELFEIARCAEYRVTTLLVYQTRGLAEAPPNVKTMLLESGSHEHRSYLDAKQLHKVIDEFLRQKNPIQWQRAISLMGYQFNEYSIYNKLYLNGEAEHICSYKGLKVNIPNLRISEIPHDFRMTSGKIVKDSFRFEEPGYITWCRDDSTSGEQAEVGVMRFEPALDCESKIVNYSFSIRTQNAYMLSKKQLAKQFPEGSDDPFLAAGQEFVSKDIPFAIELFKLQVEFPDGYQVNPQSVVYFGRESRKEGLKIPPDSFHFNGNKAILEVHRPLLYHRYAITWELPS